MLELKFRTFANGAMWHTNGLACSDDSYAMDLVDCSIGGYYKISDFDYLEDSVTMQYTGIDDKNGKEIYDGDIIKYSFFIDYDNTTRIEGISEVEKVPGGFVFYDNDDDPRALIGFSGKSFEVIGNIYETPELLK